MLKYKLTTGIFARKPGRTQKGCLGQCKLQVGSKVGSTKVALNQKSKAQLFESIQLLLNLFTHTRMKKICSRS